MLNFALCDDNEETLSKSDKMLERIFIRHNLDCSVTYKISNVSDMLDIIKDNKVDVYILDINLKSNKNGLDLAEEIRKINKNSYIIFLTCHLEYAMVAYKYKTFDYLAKPLTEERLEETILRLIEDVNGIPKKYIKLDNKNTVVDASQVQFIKRDGMRLVLHTTSTDYIIYSSFNKFQNNLPDSFKRCHKSYIANFDQITDIDPVSCTITFKDGSSCDIGPKYKSELLEVLNSYGN